MERVFGGILGILMFCSVLWVGWLRGMATENVVWRAGLCAVAAWLIGWLSFGHLGKALLQGAARITEERPSSEPQSPPQKKAGP